MAPAKRMCMRDWLRQMLDTNATVGISWENRQQETFRIEWKHGSRHGYDCSRDAFVFRAWAKYTGKLTECGPADPKRWKANFRCALNSLRDVIQVESCHDRGANASRTYRFITKERAKKKFSASHRTSEKARRHKQRNMSNGDERLSVEKADDSMEQKFVPEVTTFPIQLPPFQPKYIKCEFVMASGMDDTTLYEKRYNVSPLTPPSSPEFPDFGCPLTSSVMTDNGGDQKVPVNGMEYSGLTAIPESGDYSLESPDTITSSLGTEEFQYLEEGINFTDLQISPEMDIISSNISWVTLHEIMTSDI